MIQTEKFGLNLPEASDPMRLADFNDNTMKIAELFGKSLRVVCVTYTGDGVARDSLRIDTRGMRPVAALMNQRKVAGSMNVNDFGIGLYANTTSFSVPGGWVMWVGEDLPAKSFIGTTAQDTVLRFTAEPGYLEWKLDALGEQSATAMNFAAGITYQCIVFGVADDSEAAAGETEDGGAE